MSLSKPAPEDATASTTTTTTATSSNTTSSRTEEILQTARKDLWKVHLPRCLDPFREFVVDPCIQFWTIVLPPLVTHYNNYFTGVDVTVATYISITTLGPIRIVLRISNIINNIDDNDTNNNNDCDPDMVSGRTSRSQMPLRYASSSSSSLQSRRQLQPPSEYASSLRGFFAFTFSASADWIAALTHPHRMRKWVDAVASFRAYLEASQIGNALEEAMIKPLYRGRLLDNVKMLHDIQHLHDAERVERVRLESIILTTPTGSNSTTATASGPTMLIGDAQNDALSLDLASSMMRFATAAYGTEMVKSAMDVAANVSDLETERQAIAFHTGIPQDDVKLLKDEFTTASLALRHFIAVDHGHKAIVLALRGTLSITGALVDMQAMDHPYCNGRAHKGMAEMADAVWNESGAFLKDLLNEEEHKNYDLIITGHSLGAGTACLVHLKVHVEGLIVSNANRRVLCFGFAPPPTFYWDVTNSNCEAIERAVEHSVCYIHDFDCVPHLSVATIRRLATLLDVVDNYNEKVWFWNRALIFWGWKPVPKELVDIVTNAQKEMENNKERCTDCKMIIPAKVVVWCKKIDDKFEAIPCCPRAISDMNIFVCEDMVAHHLPEQYEDSFDAILQVAASANTVTGLVDDRS